MITLHLPLTTLAVIFFLLFVSGKAFQSGGIQYARGQNWQPHTLLGAAISFFIFFTLLFHADPQSVNALIGETQ